MTTFVSSFGWRFTSTTLMTMLIFAVIVAMATAEVATVNKTVLTFNTFLYHTATSESRTDRRDAIMTGIRDVAADVVCLQEVWIADDLARIVQGLNDVYPYSYSMLHDTGEFPTYPDAVLDPACPADVFQPFITCYLTSGCLNSTNLNFCLVTACPVQFFALPQKCIACGAFLALNDAMAFLEKCAGEPAVGKPNVNDPGLLILSKHRVTSANYVDYHPGYTQVTRRGYVSVVIDDIGAVICTHLSSLDPAVSYSEPHLMQAGVFSSYTEQSIDEIGKLVNASTTSGEPYIVMGDLNVGPAVPAYNLTAEVQELYDLLPLHLNTTLLNVCSFCQDNYYNALKPGNKVIDHVLVVDHNITSVERVLDDAVVPSTGHPLSDHYGVLATIEISPNVVTSSADITSVSVSLAVTMAILQIIMNGM